MKEQGETQGHIQGVRQSRDPPTIEGDDKTQATAPANIITPGGSMPFDASQAQCKMLVPALMPIGEKESEIP